MTSSPSTAPASIADPPYTIWFRESRRHRWRPFASGWSRVELLKAMDRQEGRSRSSEWLIRAGFSVEARHG